MNKHTTKIQRKALLKVPTGIEGFDEITGGGVPHGRETLVCGTAGSGKTLFAMEFLVHGAKRYNEPGVFVAMEESAGELVANFGSLGFDLRGLIARKKILIHNILINRSNEEAGHYDLDSLFVQLHHAIETIGATRVVLDSLEALFPSLKNPAILRAGVLRLFRWLKKKGITTIATGERGEGTLTRHGLEEYISDCVILLDNRMSGHDFMRSLRIVKYRGSLHGVNEYPMLIDEKGLSVRFEESVGSQ